MKKRLFVRSIKSDLAWLGEVKRVHVFGDYQVAEYRGKKDKASHFHPYVDGKSTSHSFSCLEEAVVFAITYKAEGPNSARYIAEHFVKGIGLK